MSAKEHHDQASRERRVRGGCLCGAVRFEFDATATELELCHCRRCRKATGSAFLPSLQVVAERFRFVAGEEAIRTICLPLEVRPPPYLHAFCGICGSPAPYIHAATGRIAVPAGSLEDDPPTDVVRHIYVEHEAPWYGRAKSAQRLTSAQIRDLRRLTGASPQGDAR